MASLPAGRIVVDASLLIAFAEQDAAAARFVPARDRMTITSVNFGEVLYKLDQRSGMPPVQTEQLFSALGINVDDVSVGAVRSFADLKKMDAASCSAQLAQGTPADQVKTLSLADMTCLGYALHRSLPVLTGDRHWTTLHSHSLRLNVYDFHDGELSP